MNDTSYDSMTLWHIDMFPWRGPDKYMHQDLWSLTLGILTFDLTLRTWTMLPSRMIPTFGTTISRVWSCRPLDDGIDIVQRQVQM